MTEWVNFPTDEQFTAIQFATFHGNFELIIKMSEEMNADHTVKNTYGASVLHIAAQGDQPACLFYFIKVKHMDINDPDNKGSTPLHWACFSMSEYSLSYILAMEPNLEARDKNGFTPLHLAIKSVYELKSSRPVRSLLLKGSKRSATNKAGQTSIEMIKPELEENLKAELNQMLQEPVYFECFMRRVPLVPIRPNHRT